MYRKFLMAAVAIASVSAVTAPAYGQLKLRSLEEAIESSTEIVSVPGSVPASLSVKRCASCAFLTLSVDGTSRFFIGKQQVSLADLHRYANRATTRLDVFYDKKTQRVTRMILRTELDAADAAKTQTPSA